MDNINLHELPYNALLMIQKLIRFRRHELYSEDEAPILSAVLAAVESELDNYNIYTSITTTGNPYNIHISSTCNEGDNHDL